MNGAKQPAGRICWMPCAAAGAWNLGRGLKLYCVRRDKGQMVLLVIQINSQRLPKASFGFCRPFFRWDCTKRSQLVASPLVRWNPPDVINSSCWAANLLASLSDSQDVAKSFTYMLCSTSAAARGAETRCRHTCTLTVLLARKREQCRFLHTLILNSLLQLTTYGFGCGLDWKTRRLKAGDALDQRCSSRRKKKQAVGHAKDVEADSGSAA
ncbi:hypothetical protein T02_5390 [Trichinella nativa]|uniref:Uncharacterized protein n=1 Tax=Trichinella nativa TaxID=6335 RepID=A0A0V1KRF4_9BILA|nr:hypothetical protein T02_5390 [Trichinella nativa]